MACGFILETAGERERESARFQEGDEERERVATIKKTVFSLFLSFSDHSINHAPHCGTRGHLSSCVRRKQENKWRRERVSLSLAFRCFVFWAGERKCFFSLSPSSTSLSPLTFRLSLRLLRPKRARASQRASLCRPLLTPLLLLSPAPQDQLAPPSVSVVLWERQGDEREARRAPKPFGEETSFFPFEAVAASFFSPRSRSPSPFLSLLGLSSLA